MQTSYVQCLRNANVSECRFCQAIVNVGGTCPQCGADESTPTVDDLLRWADGAGDELPPHDDAEAEYQRSLDDVIIGDSAWAESTLDRAMDLKRLAAGVAPY